MKFIRVFDHLFDVLNSRKPLAKGYKTALRVTNKATWEQFLNKAHEYIKGLKDASRKPMHTTQWEIGFIGFMVAIQSTRHIFQSLVEAPHAPLQYLHTYNSAKITWNCSLGQFGPLMDLITILQHSSLLLRTSIF